MTRSSGFKVAYAVVTTAAFTLLAAPGWAATTKLEAKCASAMGKAGAKVVKTALKETAKCRDGDISGKAPDTCPNAGNTAKINDAIAGAADSAAKSCKSTCSGSDTVECVSDAVCPPIVTMSSGVHSQCSAGAKALPFQMQNIGFPGPHCEAALGNTIIKPSDIGQCVGELSQDPAADLIGVIYGSLNEASDVPEDALGCLKSISKATQKLASTVTKGVGKCRNAINGGAPGDPANCQTSDLKVVDSIQKAEGKLDAAIDGKCTPGSIVKLDLCGNGIGGTDIPTAKTCLKAAAREIADSNAVPVLRTHSELSMIEAAYPPRALCGNNSVDQKPNPLLLLGEECDGDDDSACPGQCLPPGDTFECTCGDRKRIRLFNHAALTDSDAGWTGESHQQGVADLSGYITELSNCDCDSMTGAACTGSSGDPVCDTHGTGLPTCSWDLFSTTSCDAHGTDGNITNDDSDCYICDDFSVNAGAFCKDERDCDAQCYNSAGSPTGPCENQVDCAAGEVCRGQCDREQTCYVQPNGAPLPVSSSSAYVCAVQRLRTDVNGTRNIVTGEHETNYKLFSLIHTGGDLKTRPCPVCGGFCEAGTNARRLCHGRCSGSEELCRFDVDCPLGETCSPNSPDCPGSFCQLALVCGTQPDSVGSNGEPINNKPCTIEYEHPLFGSMSNDCLPDPATGITGDGFKVDHAPDTSGTVTVPFEQPCTSPGFELFDCPCKVCTGDFKQGCTKNADCAAVGAGTCTSTGDGNAAKTKPNGCAPACNAVGPSFGVGCATGNTAGAGTTCAIGSVNVGKACDEDSDCPGSSCSVNPLHCSGDPAFNQNACTTNGDCGVGTCGDACPGGRCVPLCVPTGDPLQGICSAGPELIHCTGGPHVAEGCTEAAALAGCSATCAVSGDPCTTQTDCDPGEACAGPCPHATDCEAGENGIIGDSDDLVGAASCEIFDRSCFLDPIVAQGDFGDPNTDVSGVFWCFGQTLNAGVNSTAGFPGPGRVLSQGTNVTNGFTSIP